jgi:RNA recognition motif-containing protein
MMQQSHLQSHAETAKATGATTLWIGDLPHFADEAYVAGLFAAEGVVSVKLIYSRQVPNRPESFGFVTFHSHAAAADVLERYSGQPVPYTNCVFRLNWAAHGVGRTTAEGERLGGGGGVGGPCRLAGDG